MPGTTAPTSSLTVTSCYLSGSTCYNIDTGSQSGLLTSTVGLLTSVVVTPDSFNAYTSTKYTFTIVAAHSIPVGGMIVVTIPSEVSISNPTYTGNSCSSRRNLNSTQESLGRELASTGLDTSFYCTATSSTITVIDGFQSLAFSAGGTIMFDADGITNPVSLQPSSTFTAQTQTSAGYSIDQLTSGIFVTMLTVSNFQSISLSSSSLVNSASNNLTFTFSSSSGLIDGNILSIVFPSQVTLPGTFT
jgi:hypothetical protein